MHLNYPTSILVCRLRIEVVCDQIRPMDSTSEQTTCNGRVSPTKSTTGRQCEPENNGLSTANGVEAGPFEQQDNLQASLQRLNKHLQDVFAQLPSNSLFIVATGQGDTVETAKLQVLLIKRD